MSTVYGDRTAIRALRRQFDEVCGKLRPEVIRPAEGYIKYDYLVPGGYYKQLWDWDGFFIGLHFATTLGDASHLQHWVRIFCEVVDEDGYAAGCVTTEGQRSLHGKFHIKPFLSAGAYYSARFAGDFEWLRPLYHSLKKVMDYRDRHHFDENYGLYFWENAMQSGVDNNVVVSNDPAQNHSVLACDISAYQARELRSMACIAEALGHEDDVRIYHCKEEKLAEAIRTHLWFEDDASFFNIFRTDGKAVRRTSYTNFIPLVFGLASQERGHRMISRYLLSGQQLKSPCGYRTLSLQDPEFSNENVIKPYSNWRGPIWPIASYHYFRVFCRYGFAKEAAELAADSAKLLLKDVETHGSMHENYHSETGEGLAPSPDHSDDGVFSGFVGWNLLIQTALDAAAEADGGIPRIPYWDW